MGERTEYELPGAQGPAYFICGIWRRNGQPYDDLAALLDAAETHYREQTATAAEGLAAVRRIRVEAGLGGVGVDAALRRGMVCRGRWWTVQVRDQRDRRRPILGRSGSWS